MGAICVKSDIVLNIKAKRLQEVSFPEREIYRLIPLTGLGLNRRLFFAVFPRRLSKRRRKKTK